MRVLVAALFLLLTATAVAQELEVKVIDRQEHETDYSYVVPGSFSSYSNASVNCSNTAYDTNCAANGTTNGVSRPAQMVPFQVRGATLTLLLPDGRAAVVNCASKFAERMAGPRGNHRDCRVPLVDTIEALVPTKGYLYPLSRNELEVSKQRPGDWRLYRVHLFATSPHIFTLAPPLDGVLQLRPELWRASF